MSGLVEVPAFEKRSRIEVCPFSEADIATCEVWILSLIAAKGVLPMRMQLAPLRMQATLREMALERLHASAQGKALPELMYPESKW